MLNIRREGLYAHVEEIKLNSKKKKNDHTLSLNRSQLSHLRRQRLVSSAPRCSPSDSSVSLRGPCTRPSLRESFPWIWDFFPILERA